MTTTPFNFVSPETVEVLVSTMNQRNTDIAGKMNLSSNCLIINQSDFENKEISQEDNYTIKFFSYHERGLSRSRNRALDNASGDLCIFADDDLIYDSNYVEKIKTAYSSLPDADIIIFNVPSKNSKRPSNIRYNTTRLGFLDTMKVASYQISFRRRSIIKNNIRFNVLFGAGSRYYCGEENIFLYKCLNKKMVVYHYPTRIAEVEQNTSTWFNGYDKEYFISRGAIFYEMSRRYYFFLIMQFALRKLGAYRCNTGFFNAIKLMIHGKNLYKRDLISA